MPQTFFAAHYLYFSLSFPLDAFLVIVVVAAVSVTDIVVVV